MQGRPSESRAFARNRHGTVLHVQKTFPMNQEESSKSSYRISAYTAPVKMPYRHNSTRTGQHDSFLKPPIHA